MLIKSQVSIKTVLEPAENYDLVSLETIKAELGINENDVSKDTLLERRIKSATEEISSYCKRVFAKEKIKETWRYYALNQPLVLRQPPINSIESIELDDSEIAASNYEFDPENGLIWYVDDSGYRDYWPFSNKAISIIYMGGYKTIPATLEEACVRLIRFRWFMVENIELGISPTSGLQRVDVPGVISKSYFNPGTGSGGSSSPSIPRDVRDLLMEFKLLAFA